MAFFYKKDIIDAAFDSRLENPNRQDPTQNALLALELKIKLNFVDGTNPKAGVTVQRHGKWYAKDSDDWLFPIVPWNYAFKEQLAQSFRRFAENTWNYQFLLVAPRDYAELDFFDVPGGWIIRPNALCMLRIRLVDTPGGRTHPSETISKNLVPHRTIDVVSLDLHTREVHRDAVPAGDNNQSLVKQVRQMNAKTFRSNEDLYDDRDVFAPNYYNQKQRIWHNTIGHEIGHALGEDHIMCLKHDARCTANPNGPYAYGHGSANPYDQNNIMGGGNNVEIINSRPWTTRVTQHTHKIWTPTKLRNMPPRRAALGTVYKGDPEF